MRPVAGFPGVWKCTAVPEHEFDEDGATEDVTPEEQAQWAREAARRRAGGQYWLSHIGIYHPLLPPPQGNTKDGTYCLPLGEIQRGSNKSGRRRKKPAKKGRPSYLEPWSEV